MNEVINKTILDNADASTPAVSDLVTISGPYCLDIEFTGSPVGTLYLQCSLDGINFVTYGSQAINGARSWPYNTPDSMYKYFKLVWTPVSGTGNVTIRCRTFNYSP